MRSDGQPPHDAVAALGHHLEGALVGRLDDERIAHLRGRAGREAHVNDAPKDGLDPTFHAGARRKGRATRTDRGRRSTRRRDQRRPGGPRARPHKPAKDEYEKLTHALILGYGGVPMFFGRTKPDSYDFFSRSATGPNGPARDSGEIEGIDKLSVEVPG